jgi:hypothetical protein
MHGDLSEMSAADACRELASRGVTGALAIVGPDGPGRVLFDEGALLAAVSPTPRARLGDRLVGAGLLEDAALTKALEAQARAPGRTRLGAMLVERELVSRDAVRLFVQEQLLDALFEVVGWRYGAFEFVEGRPSDVPEVPLRLAVDDALVEVARRHREWAELSELIPDLESVPAFRTAASSASASLEPDEFAVLASIDGDRSIRQLASDLGYGEFEAARIVYGLALLGIVEVFPPEDEVGAAFDEAFAAAGAPGRQDVPDTDGTVDTDDGTVLTADLPFDLTDDARADDEHVAPPEDGLPDAGEEAPAAAADGPGPDDAVTGVDTSWPEDDDTTSPPATDVDAPPAAEHAPPPPADEPPAAADGHRAGSEVDDLSSVLVPLPGSPGDERAPSSEWPDPPPAADHEKVSTEDDDRSGDDHAEDGAPSAPQDPAVAAQAPRPPESGDVSDFLRELSRLALDDPPEPPAPRREPRPPEPEPPPKPPTRDDPPRRRKRGLFGRGG